MRVFMGCNFLFPEIGAPQGYLIQPVRMSHVEEGTSATFIKGGAASAAAPRLLIAHSSSHDLHRDSKLDIHWDIPTHLTCHEVLRS